MLLCGLIAAGSFYALRGMRGRLPSTLKSIIIANAIYYAVLAIAAFIGLLGTLWRKAKLLSTYAFYLGWSLGLQLVIDGVYLYAFFSQSRQELIDHCIDGSTDSDIQQICENQFNTNKWSLVVGMVIGLLIQFWAAYIVTSYAKRLQEQTAWRSGPGIVPPVHASGPRYVHVGDEESHIPLAGPSYPYKDSHHSFGART